MPGWHDCPVSLRTVSERKNVHRRARAGWSSLRADVTSSLTPLTSPRALEQACERLSAAPHLAVDTEFHRERTFFAQLCLIQVASPEEVVIIDPLALRELAPLRELLLRPEITKVFHAARQDLEIFHDLWGLVPSPVFDTQVAASVLGIGHQVGYARLVEDVLGVKLEKAGTLTDWARRPLATEQLRYAADDVLHLIEAYDVIVKRLKEQGREDWVQRDMAVLADPEQYRADPESAWRSVRGASNMQGPARTAMRLLAAWRDEVARARNIPRRWALSDEALVEIARRRPETLDDLGRVRGLNARFLSEHGARLLDLMQEARSAAPEKRPAKARPMTPEAEVLADLLQCLVRLRARENGVAPTQLATREQVERIALEGDAADVLALTDWRREMVGEDLLALRDGRARLVVKDGIVSFER